MSHVSSRHKNENYAFTDRAVTRLSVVYCLLIFFLPFIHINEGELYYMKHTQFKKKGISKGEEVSGSMRAYRLRVLYIIVDLIE